jgi:hypothetical protein
MERLRRYQLTHAEQVTEGMNRLAQALVCLTDPVARTAYDAKLFRRSAKRPNASVGSARSNPRSQRGAPADEESEQPLRPPASSLWLLLAWILWLSVGVGGVAAGIIFYPAIRASYYGESMKPGPAKKDTSKAGSLKPLEKRPPGPRE